MFLSRNKENNVYSYKPQFYHIKVGFKGVKIIKACFRDIENFVETQKHGKRTIRVRIIEVLLYVMIWRHSKRNEYTPR